MSVDVAHTRRPVHGEWIDVVDLIRRPAWHSQAACVDIIDPSIFFPHPTEHAKAAAAKAICAECPVQHQCLEAHLHEAHGIWGGKSERQRRRIKAARARAG